MPAATKKIALTDRSLKALKAAPPGRRTVVWDALLPGHAVRVTDKGQRSFYAVKRRAGTSVPSWVLLGNYPTMTLSEAREKARDALIALAAGQDPKALAKARQQTLAAVEQEAAQNSFAAVAEDFIRKYLPTIKSAKVYESRIRREMIPALGTKDIASLRRRDIIKLLEDVAARSGNGAAQGALSVLRHLLNWAVQRDLVDVNPASAIKPAAIFGKTEARDRLLEDHELAAIWRALGAVGEPFTTIYKLLLLTGARREEIAAATWTDYDEDAGTLLVPPERTKNGQAMLIPLCPTANDLIAKTPRCSGPYIFTTTAGRVPVKSMSQAKERLDAAIRKQGDALATFVVHDFRRAVRSNLGRLGIATHIAELCLGHTQKGIVAVYDRYSYLDERRDALMRWEARLLSVVAPQPTAPGKVVPMRAGIRQ